MSSVTLKTVLFMGSARNCVPSWGGDSRLGSRVLAHVVDTIKSRTATCGADKVTHDLTVFDPLECFGDGGALEGDAELRTPHFFLKAGDNPKQDAMAQTIKEADAIIVVTAEYNHSVPPALASLLGHFGGSNFAFKPSGCIGYSVGPWGGMRGIVALRTILLELGCLPVSKTVGYPTASSMFHEDGTPTDSDNRLLHQLPSMLSQVEWLAIAMRNQRITAGLPK